MYFLLALSLLSIGSHASSPVRAMLQSASEPSDSAAVSDLTLKIYNQIRGGQIDASLFTPQMNASLSPDVLAANRAAFQKMGVPTMLEIERREQSKFSTKYSLLATFPAAQMHLHVVLDPAGKVSAFFITN